MNYLLNKSGGKALRKSRKIEAKCAKQTRRNERAGSVGRRMFLEV